MPLVFAGYWLCPPRYRNLLLLFASWYFYYAYNPVFLFLLIGTAGFDFYCGQWMLQFPLRKKTFFVLSLASNLGVLFAFKYSVFFWNASVLSLGLNGPLLQQVIIPAGLSFYTFQSLSYTIDIYRGTYVPREKLNDFLLFVSFFPHMVAGPIVRYQSLMPQLKATTYFKNINWQGFATLVIWGYFKKLVIADNLALLINPVFNNVTAYSGFELLLSGFLFVLQLYCDFSGYSDIATGVAKLFNVDLSINWRRPLLATSVHQFWKRYHISTTSWFREYLYVGLGGNRLGYSRTLLNAFLIFLISGLWHGANFTFIIWGAIHGLFYVSESVINKKYPLLKVPIIIKRVYVLLFLALSFLAFRANSVTDLIYMYKTIFSASASYLNLSTITALQFKLFYLVILAAVIILLIKELNEEWAYVNKHRQLYLWSKQIFYLALVVIIFLVGNFSANTFIYFQF